MAYKCTSVALIFRPRLHQAAMFVLQTYFLLLRLAEVYFLSLLYICSIVAELQWL